MSRLAKEYGLALRVTGRRRWFDCQSAPLLFCKLEESKLEESKLEESELEESKLEESIV